MRRRISTTRSAFTLTELLVVIGIILVLAGILLPMVIRAYKTGDRARTQGDFNAIAQALDAYKADFGDYPRVTYDMSRGQPYSGPNTGFAILAQALLSPGGVAVPDSTPTAAGPYTAGDVRRSGTGLYVALKNTSTAPPGTVADWGKLFDAGAGTPTWTDGVEGPGFRIRAGGKVYPPYLNADKFKVRKDGFAILDRDESPILYFPAIPRRPAINNPDFYVGRATLPPAGYGLQAGQRFSMYDADENLVQFRLPGESTDANSLARIRMMLGDFGVDGGINDNVSGSNETANTEAPFLLWSAGPDKVFGPAGPVNQSPIDHKQFPIFTTSLDTNKWKLNANAVKDCDDVTNFGQ